MAPTYVNTNTGDTCVQNLADEKKKKSFESTKFETWQRWTTKVVYKETDKRKKHVKFCEPWVVWKAFPHFCLPIYCTHSARWDMAMN